MKTAAWVVIALALTPNTLRAFGVVAENDWFRIVRFGLSSLVIVVLAALAVSWIMDRRRRRDPAKPR